jgi:hypothetical protein
MGTDIRARRRCVVKANHWATTPSVRSQPGRTTHRTGAGGHMHPMPLAGAALWRRMASFGKNGLGAWHASYVG